MARRFEDLEVWQQSRELTRRIYALTHGPAWRADLELCRQIRRAAVSVMSNIAEGFERGSTKEFVHALYIARGSAGEVRSQLYTIMDVMGSSPNECATLQHDYAALSRRIWSLIQYLQCEKQAVTRETEADYSIAPDA